MKKIFLFVCALTCLISDPLSAQNRLYPNEFPLGDVLLLDGPFKHARDLNIEVLFKYDVDRLLAPYRKEAGLPKKAECYPNWEGLDGHVGGHYLSAMAMNYAATGHPECKKRMEYMLLELKACQDANTVNNPDWGVGYAGGFPNSTKLWPAFKKGDFELYFSSWAPFYNLHKMVAGLRDVWLYCGYEDAGVMFLKFCDWGISLTSALSDDQMQQMLNTEHGGMNEMFADAYQITGDEKYLIAAKRFSHRQLLDPLSEGIDNLDNKHANTQIPKFTGFVRIAELCHDEKYDHASRFFWETVTTHRSLAFGGNSRREHFPGKTSCLDFVNVNDGPESCNSYNMLKLTEDLFRNHPSAKYADYYERTLYNHILSTQHPGHGGYVYFTAARPRHYRVYSAPNEAMWCCVGTGMENHGKYNQFIYTHSNDSLYLNLFVASELNWKEKGVKIRQETTFPIEEQTKLTVTEGSARFNLLIRYPGWVSRGTFKITINGKDVSYTALPSSYAGIDREWKKGDVVQIMLPMRNTIEQLPNVPAYIAFMHGPILLGAKTGTEDLKGLIADNGRWAQYSSGEYLPVDKAPILIENDIQNIADKLEPVKGQPLNFKINIKIVNPMELTLEPFFQIHDARYMMYWLTLTNAGYKAYLDSLADIEEEKLALEKRTIDIVAAGEQQPENDHAMKTENSGTGNNLNEFWRDAHDGGCFSYDMATHSETNLSLFVRYWGAEWGNRQFDITIDDVKLLTEDNTGRWNQSMFKDVVYPIPDSMVKGKTHVRVNFQAYPGTIAGAVYAVRLLRSDNRGSGTGETRQIRLFDSDWRFYAGEINSAEKPEYNDTSWLSVNIPHDWSIEGHSLPKTTEENAPVFKIVKGEWKFCKGDDLYWKNPDIDDSSWQIVQLPSTWELHSNYTPDNVSGWYRRELTVPADLTGNDIFINVGKIDDADETYFNGVKVGGMGYFPPAYASAWDIFRYYKVPHEIIHYGGKNSIAVRVFDGIMGGGIYTDGEKIVEGPFESTCQGGSGAGYINAGIGWYRKTFKLDENIKGRHVFIEFDGVYMNSDVWINGVHLGNRPYGYSSFQYELTQHLKFGDEKNVLAVRVDVKQPCSRWYSGAGIYRNVRLTITNPVHIAHWGTYVTTPDVTESEAIVRVETKIRNQSASTRQVTLETVIVDESGREAASSSSPQKVEADSIRIFEQFIKLPKPKLWSLENPTLYRVESKVHVNDRIVDMGETPFGIRTFELTLDKGFFLNGRHVDIKGVCLHHDLGCLGTAVNTRAIERQLEIMKSMGCNAIRTSHNPPAPELLDLCDRMGFLVMDEAFDEWKRSKTMFGYGQFFDEWSKRDLTDMIRRDRNHPSIILWSIGNEIPEQDNTDAYEMSKRLVDICHIEDPTRLVTSGCNSLEAAVKSGFSRPLDVVGINYQLPVYQTLHGKVKLIASETASAVSTRGDYNLVQDNDSLKIIKELNNQCTSYDITAPGWGNTAESTLKAVKDASWVAGEFVWTGFDYIGEPSPFSWPSVSSYFGIVDLCGFPKDRYYLYQSRWTDKPMVHILPHWNWPGFEGKEIPVWSFSNCESVELLLNGQSLGEKKFSDTKDLHLVWNVPYSPGTLKAIAKNHGKTLCTDEVQTAGAPVKIMLTPDRTEIRADGKDLSYIKVEIVDQDGHVCPNADNLVKLIIEGKGIIAGVGNGNPISHEYFKASERKAFHGLCLAVIQSKHEMGTIRLSAESEGLQAADLIIHVK